MFGFEQLSVVEVSLSVQSDADLHLILHTLFEQEELEFPGLTHVSVVRLLESSQAASDEQITMEGEFVSLPEEELSSGEDGTETVWVHDDDTVPGFRQVSVVSELLSLQPRSELQVIDEEARLRQLLLQPPVLLHVSVVEELLSLQLPSKLQAIVQLPVVFTRSNAAFFALLTVYVPPFDDV